jgi:tRNA(adenine34) deaminase
MNDHYWMKQALIQARIAELKDEVPIGAVVVKNNELIGFGHNKVISTSDPTAHAEIVALRHAAKQINNYRLVNCTLYVTIEPCLMCFGSLIHSRISKVIFGALEPKAGVFKSNLKAASLGFINHKIDYNHGILEHDCKTIIQNFFKQKRLKKH